MIKRFLLLPFVLLLVAWTSPPALTAVPRFEKSDCTVDVPSGQTLECGYLVVPEDRQNPASPTIKLAVIIFKSPNPNPQPDPMIYLNGGPGGKMLKNIKLTFAGYAAPYLEDRDVIVFDQRGVGESIPALDCPEYDAMYYRILRDYVPVEENTRLSIEAITACAERLKSEGVELGAYTSVESAADVNDLRQVLGYEQLNLFGLSYGTRLALTIMRDYQATIRSVVLDSVVPLQISRLDDIVTVSNGMNTLFNACADDPDCNAAYPDLNTIFQETMVRLDLNPVTITIPDVNHLGQPITTLVDGTIFAGLVFQAMYMEDMLAKLPGAIYAAHDGDLSAFKLASVAGLLQLEQIDYGMLFAVNCNEEYIFDTPEAVQHSLDHTPPYLWNFARSLVADLAIFKLCENFGTHPTNPVDNSPVRSDIPTLLLAGEFDPITPLSHAEKAAATLSNSWVYEFPALTHGVMPFNLCATSMVAAFFNDPSAAADSTCIENMSSIRFDTPDQPLITQVSDVTLVPFTDDQFGFTSLKPEGWSDLIIGTVGRQQSVADQTALIQMSLPFIQPDQYLDSLVTTLGLPEKPVSLASITANDLTWQVYQFDLLGYPTDLAMTQANGMMYMIQLTSHSDERDGLYQAVFLPVIDAFKLDVP